LHELDEKAMLRVLTEPKNALVKQYQKLVEMENAKLVFEDAALMEIVRKAMQAKTGARSLRSKMESVMLDILYEIPNMPKLETVTITDKVVTDGAKPKYKTGPSRKRA